MKKILGISILAFLLVLISINVGNATTKGWNIYGADSFSGGSNRPLVNNAYAPDNMARHARLLVDSLTFGIASATTTDTTTYVYTRKNSTVYRYFIAFRKPVWNFKIWTVPAATDSGGINIWFSNTHSLSAHSDTIMRKTVGIGAIQIGLNAKAETLSCPFRIDPGETLFFHSVKGGDADTTCKTYLQFNW
jgi:hypothetical protein